MPGALTGMLEDFQPIVKVLLEQFESVHWERKDYLLIAFLVKIKHLYHSCNKFMLKLTPDQYEIEPEHTYQQHQCGQHVIIREGPALRMDI